MSPENPTYNILVALSSYAGFLTARTSHGGSFDHRAILRTKFADKNQFDLYIGKPFEGFEKVARRPRP